LDLDLIYLFFGFVNRSNNITLTLGWNVIPNAGCLPRVRANGSTSFIFPDQYTTLRSASQTYSSQE
jgi:hypothetical protein